MSIYKNFRFFKEGIENWFSVALNMFILKRDVDCKIRNVGTVTIKGGENYLNSSLFRSVVSSASTELSAQQIAILKTYLNQFNDEIVTIINLEDGRKFKFLNHEIYTIFESFFHGEYEYIPNGDDEKILIDIGANIADTALYFANKGYTVYAFEPLPQTFEIGKQNLNLNPEFCEKIKYINKAVSCKNGIITINFDENNSAISGEFTKGNEVKVEAITIDEIIKTYDINPDILKIDCEGCEVNIIGNSDLKMFSAIILEYHTIFTGVDVEKLIKPLEKQGFELIIEDKKEKGLGILYLKNKNQN